METLLVIDYVRSGCYPGGSSLFYRGRLLFDRVPVYGHEGSDICRDTLYNQALTGTPFFCAAIIPHNSFNRAAEIYNG